MKKNFKKMLAIVLCCVLVCPVVVYAEEPDYQNKNIYDAAAEVATAFEDLGVDNNMLIDITNLTKKDASFYTRNMVPTTYSATTDDFWGGRLPDAFSDS